jgi:membrane protein insertase Oxa1/YidC/SpoIIIJ
MLRFSPNRKAHLSQTQRNQKTPTGSEKTICLSCRTYAHSKFRQDNRPAASHKSGAVLTKLKIKTVSLRDGLLAPAISLPADPHQAAFCLRFLQNVFCSLYKFLSNLNRLRTITFCDMHYDTVVSNTAQLK